MTIREQLHTLTHRFPGVPAHDAALDGHGHHHGRAHHAHHAHHTPHRTLEPRVLVRWQNWIASLASGLERE